MRWGAAVSGGVHAGMLVLAFVGTDWITRPEAAPLVMAEVEIIDAATFEARFSRPPQVVDEAPVTLDTPSVDDATDVVGAAGDAEPEAGEAPGAPVTAARPVPVAEPVPSIAETPSPDPVPRIAEAPESPDATEPRPETGSETSVVAAPAPPARPRAPEAPPAQDPERATEALEREAETPPAPSDETALAESSPSDPAPARTPEPSAVPEPPAPEAEPETETEAPAAEQVEADASAAPQTARLPVARPARLAAAAEASSADRAPTQDPAPRQSETQAAGGSTQTATANTPPLSRSEVDGLQLGIKRFYTYTGDRSDPSLRVVIRITLDQTGQIVGRPEQRSASGGTEASQRALYQAGRRALIRAAGEGTFQSLPREKYETWKALNFQFSTDRIGFGS